MNKVAPFLFTSLLLFTTTTATAQARRQPLRLEITALDAKTHRPRSTFILGESVKVKISLTNQSRTARTVAHLPETTIDLKLRAMPDFEDGPKIHDSYVGGTGGAYYRNGMTIWTGWEPRMISLAPGQTVSRTIDDVGEHFFYHPLEEGSYTLTAKHPRGPRASVSFRIVLDEAKTIPLLEDLLASAPAVSVDRTLYRWAKATLNLVRHPSISGHVRTTDGRPLKDIRMIVTGTQQTWVETRNDGSYQIQSLSEDGTYTITPEIPHYHRFEQERYTIQPASRTISFLNGKATNVNFTATRIRVSTNVALEDEGAKATASSILDHDFETENVIDGFPAAGGWHTGSSGWNDGTPDVFPDWIEVNFGRLRSINWINVFTVPDNYRDPSDPDPTLTFTQYGIADFDVQYWTGRAWRTVPNGAIRGNRNVVRKISFPVIATNKIRVVVFNALGGESRITEIEAWHVNDLPQAKIKLGGKHNAKNITTNSAVNFLTEAFDIDGKIHEYELDFGDNGNTYEWEFDHQKPGDKPRLTHRHVYENEGTYTVKLRLVDDNNEANETTMVVNVIDPPVRSKSTAKAAKPEQ
jgi:hypothetical protein